MEQDQFLKDLEPKDTDILEQPLEEPKEETKEEEVPEDVKNRRHRRLEEKLQREREANIQLSERLKVISETQKFREDSEPSEYLKGIERIYGTDSPEAKEATELLKSALTGLEKTATDRALERFREEQRKQAEEVKNEEKRLDEMVEEIEDTYNVDLNPETQKSFFTLLEKMSPKDAEGNILHYADHHSVYEIFQSRAKKPENRAKDLASRAMVNSNSVNNSTLQSDSTERWLKENNII